MASDHGKRVYVRDNHGRFAEKGAGAAAVKGRKIRK